LHRGDDAFSFAFFDRYRHSIFLMPSMLDHCFDGLFLTGSV
jgi:hypothetical protein